MISAIDKFVEDGASVEVLEEGRIYDDFDHFGQNLNFAFHSAVHHNARVEANTARKKG